MSFEKITKLIFDIDDVVTITGKRSEEIKQLVDSGKIKASGKGNDIRFTLGNISTYIEKGYSNYSSERMRAEGTLLSLYRKKRGQ